MSNQTNPLHSFRVGQKVLYSNRIYRIERLDEDGTNCPGALLSYTQNGAYQTIQLYLTPSFQIVD